MVSMPYTPKKNSTNYLNRMYMQDGCPINRAIDLFSGRWTIQVLVSVEIGHERFSTLKAHLGRISDHVLGQRLKHLVNWGLIEKSEHGRDATYAVTKSGEELIKALGHVISWYQKTEKALARA